MKLGEMLVADGRLGREQLERALDAQSLSGGRLGTNLLELGLISEPALTEALRELRTTRVVGRSELARISHSVLRLIPDKLARRYGLVPFLIKGKTLFVASMDPGDALREDEIAFLTSYMVRTCLATEFHLRLALRQYYKVPIDPRFIILARRLSRGTVVSEGSGTNVTGSGSGVRALTLPPPPSTSSAPKSAVRGSVTTAQRPQSLATPVASPTQRAGEAPSVEFIEIDDVDLALLRRPNHAESPASLEARALEAAPTTTPTLPSTPDDGFDMSIFASGDLVDDGAEDVDLGPDDLDRQLMTAAQMFQEADLRDDIGDGLLHVASRLFKRSLLVTEQRGTLVGWRVAGAGLDEAEVRKLSIDAKTPSVFSGLSTASSFWLGPLVGLPANQQIVEALGGRPPRDCLVLPIVLRSKVVCYLYGDNLDESIAGSPVSELKRLVGKAGLAFEVYILKNKIRVL